MVPVGAGLAGKILLLAITALLLDFPKTFWADLAWKWDGEHYLGIARTGYEWRFDGTGDSVHFAFLYPMVIRLFGGSEAAALLINNAASLAAIAVVALHLGRRPALFLALFPPFLVYGTVAYSEGLYLLLAALALWAWDRRRLEAPAGIAAGLATMARFMGGPALLVAALPWSRWKPFGRAWTLPRLAGLALIGLAGFGLWVYFIAATGAGPKELWCGYCMAQKPWGGAIVPPWQHFFDLLYGSFTNQGGTIAQHNLGPLDFAIRDALFLVPFVWGLTLLWRRAEPATLFAYSAVVLLTGITLSGTPGAALPRYLLAGYPAIAIVGTRLTSRGAWASYAAAGVVLGAHGLAHHLYGYWS